MNFQTPDWVCNIMASTMDDVPEWGEWYLDGGTYTILEPTPGEGNLVNILKRKFPHATIITPEADFWDMPVPETKYNLIMANPPFTPMAEGFRYLQRFVEMAETVVVLMPWLTLINSEERTKWLVEHGLHRVIHLPRRAFPSSRVQTCIMELTEGCDEEIVLEVV